MCVCVVADDGWWWCVMVVSSWCFFFFFFFFFCNTSPDRLQFTPAHQTRRPALSARPRQYHHKSYLALRSKTLIVVDEEGYASTFGLDTVIGYALATGARSACRRRQQLASSRRRGVSDIAEHHGALTSGRGAVHRSRRKSGQSRDTPGRPTGIAYYLDHHRVHVGADQIAADMAYTAWAADIAAGRDGILLPPTNDLVADSTNAPASTVSPTSPPQPPSPWPTASQPRPATGPDPQKRPLAAPQPVGWAKNGHPRVLRHVTTTALTFTTPWARQRQGRGPAGRYVTTNTTLGMPAPSTAPKV